MPFAQGHGNLFISLMALDGAVVVTVSVEVCAVFPLRVTEEGLKLQVAGSLAAVGLIEQLRFTAPEYPFVPITLIVEVFPVVAPAFTLIAASLLLAPKDASAVIVSATVVDEVRLPEVPVIVTVTGPPTTTVPVAVRVNTCVPADVPAAKLAVTPLGNPDAASATVPVKPPMLDTEIVLVPLPFCATDTLSGEADNMKLGGTVTVTEADADALL